MIEENGRVYFQCAECLTTADKLETLVTGKVVILRRGNKHEHSEDGPLNSS